MVALTDPGPAMSVAGSVIRTVALQPFWRTGRGASAGGNRTVDPGSAECLRSLQAALEQVPKRKHRAEATPMPEELARFQSGGRHVPQLLADILPIVLARLGAGGVQSTASGEEDPT